jgi:hypothetical protein
VLSALLYLLRIFVEILIEPSFKTPAVLNQEESHFDVYNLYSFAVLIPAPVHCLRNLPQLPFFFSEAAWLLIQYIYTVQYIFIVLII